MLTSSKNFITPRQAAIAIISSTFAVGILSLPRSIAEEMGTPDVWIGILFGGITTMSVGYGVAKLCDRFPRQSFYEYSHTVMGKFFGWFFNICLTVYFISMSAHETRMLAELVRHFLLDKTPYTAVMIPFIFAGVYLVVGGALPVVRLIQFFLPITLVVFFAVLLLNLQNFEINNLRPVLSEGWTPVLKSLKSAPLSFLGYDVIFVLSLFMRESTNMVKPIMVGIGVPILIYVCTVTIAVGTFTMEETIKLNFPTMELARQLEFPGGFFEQFESVFIVIWLMKIYATFVMYYYASCFGVSQLVKKWSPYVAYTLSPIVYFIAIYPEDYNAAREQTDYIGYFGFVTCVLFPLLILLIAVIRKKGVPRKSH